MLSWLISDYLGVYIVAVLLRFRGKIEASRKLIVSSDYMPSTHKSNTAVVKRGKNEIWQEQRSKACNWVRFEFTP